MRSTAENATPACRTEKEDLVRNIQEYSPVTSGKFSSVLIVDFDDLTHTARLTIDEVTEADLGKEFILHTHNYYGETNYTVTLANIGGGLCLQDYRPHGIQTHP